MTEQPYESEKALELEEIRLKARIERCGSDKVKFKYDDFREERTGGALSQLEQQVQKELRETQKEAREARRPSRQAHRRPVGPVDGIVGIARIIGIIALLTAVSSTAVWILKDHEGPIAGLFASHKKQAVAASGPSLREPSPREPSPRGTSPRGTSPRGTSPQGIEPTRMRPGAVSTIRAVRIGTAGHRAPLPQDSAQLPSKPIQAPESLETPIVPVCVSCTLMGVDHELIGSLQIPEQVLGGISSQVIVPAGADVLGPVLSPITGLLNTQAPSASQSMVPDLP